MNARILRLVAVAALCALAATGLAAAPAMAEGEGSCPNEALRTGFDASLPECRAYELVSPPGTAVQIAVGEGVFGAGQDIFKGARIPGGPGGETLSSSGERLVFTSKYAPSGSAWDSQWFLASRGAQGWSTVGMIPPQSPEYTIICTNAFAIAFTPELTSWVLGDGFGQFGHAAFSGPEGCGKDEPELVQGEPQGVQNLFLDEGPTGPYHLIDVTPPQVEPAQAYFQAASSDLSHVVFDEKAQLTPEAPPVNPSNVKGGNDLYMWTAGAVRLVTILPDGTATAGVLANQDEYYEYQGPGFFYGGAEIFTHAVSADGSRVFFVAGGDLYVRENAYREQSALAGGHCTEPEKACTMQIDASQTGGGGGGGTFMWASADGSRVFFTDAEKLTSNATAAAGKPDLYEYDFGAPEGGRLTDLTVNASEPANVQNASGVSEDGSYAYFVAQGVLTGSQQNSHGDGAVGRAQGSGELHGGGEGKGDLTTGSDTVTKFKVTNGEFFVGQEFEVEGGDRNLPPGTTVTACSPDCSAPTELTLSSKAAETRPLEPECEPPEKCEPPVAFVGYGHNQITGASTTSGAFAAGQEISGSGIRPGTSITSVGAGTLTLSQGVAIAASGTQALSAVADNLYVSHGGATTFIATLDPTYDNQDWEPRTLTSRVSENGRFLALDSTRSLTGYDNAPVQPTECHLGERELLPCTEIFLYDAQQKQLRCVSCDPTGARPTAPALIHGPDRYSIDGQGGSNEPGYLQRNVTDAGQVFFDTSEPLSPRATNGQANVYEYRDGKLQLLSTATSNVGAYFYEVSASGRDVLLTTSQPLVQAAEGSEYSIYDARVDGGFPEPTRSTACSEEDCRGALTPTPLLGAPSSQTFVGAGNRGSAPAQHSAPKHVKPKKKHRHSTGKRRRAKGGRKIRPGKHARRAGRAVRRDRGGVR